MKSKNEKLAEIIALSPVIPVVQFDDPDQAVDTANALAEGGIPIVEITLRTKNALQCIEAVIKKTTGVVVGAGTVNTPELMTDVLEIGVGFMVSPGTTQDLLTAAGKTQTPLLPGVATVSEAMALMTEGYRYAKFFPAGPAGGPSYLKSIAPVLPKLTFCPTGGLTADNAPDYLSAANVGCVGGSWVAPTSKIEAGDWEGITALAAQAAALGR